MSIDLFIFFNLTAMNNFEKMIGSAKETYVKNKPKLKDIIGIFKVIWKMYGKDEKIKKLLQAMI